MKTLRFMFWFFVAFGIMAASVSIYGACLDWPQLRRATENWSYVVTSNGDMRAVFVAEARQNIHRINLFADVVWALLGLILSALGTIGLTIAREQK